MMQKTKKRSLFVAVICLVLCVALLIGATFAWFTDTASNTGNKIQAGTLDVDLQQKTSEDPVTYVSIANSTDPVFNYDKWEPGYSDGGIFKIVNNGNLALKFNVSINASAPIQTTTVDGEQKALTDVIDVYYATSASDITMPASFEEAKTQLTKIGTLTEVLTAETIAHGVLLPKGGTIYDLPEKYQAEARVKETYAALVLHMQEEAGNEYQNLSLGATFDISVNAAQVEYEKDGFNSNQYDANAQLPQPSIATFEPVTEPMDPEESLRVETTGDVEEAEIKGAAVNGVFNEMKDESEGASNSLVMTLNVNKTGEKEVVDESTGASSTTLDLDIGMEAVMTSTPAGGTSTTTRKDIESLDDYSIIKYNLGTGYTNVSVKHDGEPMEALDSADAEVSQAFENIGGYYYGSDGILILKTKTFSPFIVLCTKEGAEVKVTKTDDPSIAPVYLSLAEFRESVNSGNTYEGYTATLQKNVNLNGTEESQWIPIGLKENNKPFKGIFDGNNNTVSGLYINRSGKYVPYPGMEQEDYSALFGLVDGDGIVKNLTVEGSVTGLNVAGIVARLDSGTVYNCINKVDVIGKTKAAGVTVLAQLDAVIEKCKNTGSVQLDVQGNNRSIGGIVALVNSLVMVKDCENEGVISTTGSTAHYIGGIIGWYQSNGGESTGENYTLSVVGCKNTGNIIANTSGNAIGGMVGKIGLGAHKWTGYIYLENCRNEGEISGPGSFADIMGNIADCASSGSYTGTAKPARVFVKGTLTVRTGKAICGNYNLEYNGSDELVANPVSVLYVKDTPVSEGGYDVYTGLVE